MKFSLFTLGAALFACGAEAFVPGVSGSYTFTNVVFIFDKAF